MSLGIVNPSNYIQGKLFMTCCIFLHSVIFCPPALNGFVLVLWQKKDCDKEIPADSMTKVRIFITYLVMRKLKNFQHIETTF